MGYTHVGDSRIYLLREGEALQRLTSDDGYFLRKIQQGAISEQDAWRIEQASHADQLNEEERAHFGKRNGITQALGDATVLFHGSQVLLCPGDRILLCSDGIHDNLTDAEIATILRAGKSATAARILLYHALQRSQEAGTHLRAKNDDMSAIVITYRAPQEKI